MSESGRSDGGAKRGAQRGMKRDAGRDPGRRARRMRLRGVLDEAWRNLASGTSHACALAMALACLMLLCAGADLASVTSIQRETDEYVASGGSTYAITYEGRIDGAACDRLASLDGVLAAGATRTASSKLTFAALPSTGVPTYDATPGAVAVFAYGDASARDMTSGMTSDGGADAASAVPADGLWLSHDAADPLRVQAGDDVDLRGGASAHVADVFDWPDDGRKSGYSYAAIAPMPLVEGETFDQCWVKAWPVPDNIESLLRIVTTGEDATGRDRPTVSQLNTTHGQRFDAQTAYEGRITVWAPLVAGVGALLVGFLAVYIRRLELASALHCGVPKPALVTQILVETGWWAVAAMLLCSPVLAWMWLENTDGDALVLTGTLLRVPAAAYAGVMCGALLCACVIREKRLFRYFKNR